MEVVGLAEDAVICGDRRLVGPRAQHVEGVFGLLEQFGPVVEGERWVGAG